MNKQRQKKAEIVKDIKDKLEASQSVILTDYRGINVADMTNLRSRLREANVEFKVLKNTLIKRAADELGIEGMDPFLVGPTAVAFGIEDPVAPAKVLSEFAKDHKELEIKGGLLEGKVIDLDKIKALADLPSKEELLAQVARGFQAPIAGLANVLQANIRNLAYALEAVRKQKEQTA
ncbi:MAG: 50S ribosomal protein L10 [Thermoanaerobacteraceae bacterium]|nr:50S ribosomal protein L10 [Thermoanaerobacteraceae bacterium]